MPLFTNFTNIKPFNSLNSSPNIFSAISPGVLFDEFKLSGLALFFKSISTIERLSLEFKIAVQSGVLRDLSLSWFLAPIESKYSAVSCYIAKPMLAVRCFILLFICQFRVRSSCKHLGQIIPYITLV